jgi:hypothetical protein
MKKVILDFFKFDRTYESGLKLYMLYGNRLSFFKSVSGVVFAKKLCDA